MAGRTVRSVLLAAALSGAATGAGAEETCTPYEAAAFDLYAEFETFRDAVRFRAVGFSPAGPYADWLDRLMALAREGGTGPQGEGWAFLLKHGFVVLDIRTVAMSYMRQGKALGPAADLEAIIEAAPGCPPGG